MDAERELDVVVFGATGFAGRLVAEYLAEHGAFTAEELEQARRSLGLPIPQPPEQATERAPR
jgi:short subunit dehydrogenase-like uncharacterized protein